MTSFLHGWPVLFLTATAAAGDILKYAVADHYAVLVSTVYQDSLAGAVALGETVDRFLAAPSAETLATAREAWIAARQPYLQSEVFRFYEGPVDQVDGHINAWPVDEAYIDHVKGDASTGIINRPDLYPHLTAETIAVLNEKEGEKSISTGFHAIEFLLWGQDFDKAGPGTRSHLEFIAGTDPGATHNHRRREYLKLVTGMLVGQLRVLDREWAENRPGNYRGWFRATPPEKRFQKILAGMGALSAAELAGERLTVPYETKEQEDEHSCFSDTTRADTVNNAIGIRNVFTGDYRRTDGTWLKGPGIDELLAEAHPALGRKLAGEIQASVTSAESIPQPFDQAILGTDAAPGRIAIHRTIQALQQQAESIAEAAVLLGGKKETE